MKAGQEFKICCKKKILGDESFVCVDFQELENKLKVGDHVIVDFGAVCMSVVGFENEADFLVSKQLEGAEVNLSFSLKSNQSFSRSSSPSDRSSPRQDRSASRGIECVRKLQVSEL